MITHFKNKIERINCPFDFTSTARVGLNYAGMLAAVLGARLTIFYVEQSILPEDRQLYEDQNDSTIGIRRLLKLEARDMQGRFGIECDYAFDQDTDSITIPVGSMSTDYDLIVMGTDGTDSLYQSVFGVNTHHVLGLTRCPVLMIPIGYDVRIPTQIFYAFDSESEPDSLSVELDRMAIPFKASVRSLRVVPDGTAEAEQKMQVLGEMLGVTKRGEFNWDFEPTYLDEVVKSVDQCIKDSGTAILALSYHHRTLFEKLFRENVVKKVSRIADYPLLVFWH
jgi:nucleotide-binding universal stress UspA family protein